MKWRYRITFGCFIFLFLMVVLRLFYWQVVRADELASLGESQYGKQIKLSPARGEIKAADGFPIAANKITYLVFANPKEVAEQDKTVRLLSPLLESDTATISSLLSMNRYWVPLKSRVTPEKKDEIAKMKLPGVGYEEQAVRFYPEASSAARLLGFVGKNETGEDTGYFGLEGYYDRQLRGKPGFAVQIHDALGNPILARMSSKTASFEGRSLNLHIDRVVQYVAERELKKGIEKYGATGGMVAIMDPTTGSMISMASYPSYDQRAYGEYAGDLYKDPIITSTYEPGSTFKPIVMAEVVNRNLVKPDTKCNACAGPVEIGGYRIKTWNDEYKPGLTMAEAIERSDNTGMVFMSQKLGIDGMISMFDKFGIGSMTGIDLQGETEPFVRPKDSWYPIDVATASFGQGISVTPIELLSAFSVIANKGKRMQPQVVSSIQTHDGEKVTIKPKVLSTPISERTAKVMTEILVNAVDKGEAKWAKPKGYRIAGKTGTAQIPLEGRYDANKTIASFIGFAPADNPKFIMLVVVDRPTTSIYGSETAAPLFFNIAGKVLTYYGITPTEPLE